ncbi:MAG: StlD/DarB family beta-ketosynthase [Bacteroidales bacterium]
MKDVFITRLSHYLPNASICNEEMEDYLGMIEGVPSRVRSIVLRQNGIKNRYYALTKNQTPTHTNAEMAVCAIRNLFEECETWDDIELLVAATSIPDQLIPSHASMIHGLLKNHPMELFSSSGVCLTAFQSLKTAYLSLAAGDKKKAICVASERTSAALLSKHYTIEYERSHNVGENPYMAFEKDFLRFMLSDGAGACLLSDRPEEGKCNLKLHWIEMHSYANEKPTCMFMGGELNKDGELNSWKDFDDEYLINRSVFAIKQDFKLLPTGVPLWVDHVRRTLKARNLEASDVDYVIPHVSSMFIYKLLAQAFENEKIELPESKWFTNLSRIGNIGSASIFVALEEFLKERELPKGSKILLMIPESGRFNYGTALVETC